MPDRLNNDTIQSPFQDAGCVRVPMDRKISIPSPDSDQEMAIRCADWKMLERRLAAASDPPKDYSVVHSALFGFSGSAWLSLIPLAIIKDLPAWVMPSSIALAVSSLLCGIFAVFLSRDQRRIRRTIMTGLLDDVKEIGARFTFGQTASQELTGSMVVDPPSQTTPIR